MWAKNAHQGGETYIIVATREPRAERHLGRPLVKRATMTLCVQPSELRRVIGATLSEGRTQYLDQA